MADNRTTQWLVLAVAAVILGAGLASLDVYPGSRAPAPSDLINRNIEVTWNWKKDVSGRTFVVFGTLRNKGPRAYTRVVLELRTEDSTNAVIARHPIYVTDLAPGLDKPFRHDVPRTGREDMGYVEVKRVIP